MTRLRFIGAAMLASVALPALASATAAKPSGGSAPASLRTVTSSTRSAPHSTGPRAQLGSPVCHRALDPVGRSFAVTATMRSMTGTERLAVNFRLLEKPAGAAAYSQVNAPGLGHWISPTDPPTLGQLPGDVWYVKHPVVDLDAPASYRFLVEFRWFGSRQQVLRTQTLRSSVCVQLELRPDLVVESIAVKPDAGAPRMNRYVAMIQNTGASAAGSFTVELTDLDQVFYRTVSRLPAHSSRSVTLVGPACLSSQPPTVTADPDDRIDVSSRAQATATASCPGASGTSGSG